MEIRSVRFMTTGAYFQVQVTIEHIKRVVIIVVDYLEQTVNEFTIYVVAATILVTVATYTIMVKLPIFVVFMVGMRMHFPDNFAPAAGSRLAFNFPYFNNYKP